MAAKRLIDPPLPEDPKSEASLWLADARVKGKNSLAWASIRQCHLRGMQLCCPHAPHSDLRGAPADGPSAGEAPPAGRFDGAGGPSPPARQRGHGGGPVDALGAPPHQT